MVILCIVCGIVVIVLGISAMKPQKKLAFLLMGLYFLGFPFTEKADVAYLVLISCIFWVGFIISILSILSEDRFIKNVDDTVCHVVVQFQIKGKDAKKVTDLLQLNSHNSCVKFIKKKVHQSMDYDDPPHIVNCYITKNEEDD